jgi:hypothetical protein
VNNPYVAPPKGIYMTNRQVAVGFLIVFHIQLYIARLTLAVHKLSSIFSLVISLMQKKHQFKHNVKDDQIIHQKRQISNLLVVEFILLGAHHGTALLLMMNS